MSGRAGWILLSVAVLAAAAARAATVEEFYRGRTVSVVIGYSVAGGYDRYGRVLSRHMGAHIPGNPTVVPQNMPGAGSLRAANYLYNAAPKDGSTFGIFTRGMAMEPLLGNAAAQFDARKFTWIGSIANEVSVCTSWHTSKVKTWADAMTTPFTVGGEGSGSDPDIFAIVLRNVFGARIRLVSGYPGTNEMALAMQRGEIDGRCGWSLTSIKAQQPQWIPEKKLNLLVQLGLTRSPELPDVPFILDEAPGERQRQVLRLIFSRQVMGRPFAAPPDIPPERAAALRRAFDDTMKDPAFLDEAARTGLEVNPETGTTLAALVDDLYRSPPDVVAGARAAIHGAQ
ncbi:MAG TPA: tripartite tricarboxylate transporter substrate-binding protein [Alphaproteobacteria bacterium]|nr:tripartite tricarboxylate transporter substrate-binding protein [Alphaproteobacteria bacterium]